MPHNIRFARIPESLPPAEYSLIYKNISDILKNEDIQNNDCRKYNTNSKQ